MTAFGLQVLQIARRTSPSYPEHDHAESGQEEVYVILSGGGEIELDGERRPLRRGMMVRVGPRCGARSCRGRRHAPDRARRPEGVPSPRRSRSWARRTVASCDRRVTRRRGTLSADALRADPAHPRAGAGSRSSGSGGAPAPARSAAGSSSSRRMTSARASSSSRSRVSRPSRTSSSCSAERSAPPAGRRPGAARPPRWGAAAGAPARPRGGRSAGAARAARPARALSASRARRGGRTNVPRPCSLDTRPSRSSRP